MIRYVSYHIGPSSVKPSREKAGGARVRLRTSAAHRYGLAITFRPSLPPQDAGACTASGDCVDRGVADLPGRSSTAVPWPAAAKAEGERPRFDERHDLDGRTRVFLS